MSSLFTHKPVMILMYFSFVVIKDSVDQSKKLSEVRLLYIFWIINVSFLKFLKYYYFYHQPNNELKLNFILDTNYRDNRFNY